MSYKTKRILEIITAVGMFLIAGLIIMSAILSFIVVVAVGYGLGIFLSVLNALVGAVLIWLGVILCLAPRDTVNDEYDNRNGIKLTIIIIEALFVFAYRLMFALLGIGILDIIIFALMIPVLSFTIVAFCLCGKSQQKCPYNIHKRRCELASAGFSICQALENLAIAITGIAFLTSLGLNVGGIVVLVLFVCNICVSIGQFICGLVLCPRAYMYNGKMFAKVGFKIGGIINTVFLLVSLIIALILMGIALSIGTMICMIFSIIVCLANLGVQIPSLVIKF